MSYKGHIVGGVIAYVVVLIGTSFLYNFTLMQALTWFFTCLLGALFPDLDTTSKIRTFFVRICGGIFLLLLVLPSHRVMILPLLPIIVIPLIVRHRGLFHRKWFLIGLPALLALATTITLRQPETVLLPTLFFIAGASSHLILDGTW